MNKKVWQVSVLISFLVFLVGCQVTEEEALELGQLAFLNNLEEEIEPNTELSMSELYLPRGFEVMEDIEYNALIQSGEQLFVLFHQPTEPRTSNVHLERDLPTAGGALLYDLRESEDQLAYIIVTEEDEDQLFVIVTVGGAKISTLTTYRELEVSIEAMTAIVQSYEAK
ncbi:hypothetical protein N0O92_03840 [Alkalihalobacillus sp. MEB130]|uniref:hypothetical protein n=1 Tax=Alkalihalobacillus sp. MEB130 TaxID=2976704 RepID=UPI0028DDF972|nr:hypothetical protein [Alkalihalobacillus sp. MEB130]MDT8859353.1 hypothetical protein [Alkalihalobacillus sp. MEB130]